MNLPSKRNRFQPSSASISLWIALAAVLLTAGAQWLTTPSRQFFADEWLRDRFIGMQTSSAPDPRILVVDIDEDSIAALGPWPWPRTRLASLIETLLSDYGARGVALDILLSDRADPAGDARLALLAEHGPVVLAQAFDYSTTRPSALNVGVLGGARQPADSAVGVGATGYIGNHLGMARARYVGNIGFIPDPDGALRRLPMLTSFGGHTYPSLALALLECCSGQASPPLRGGALTRVSFKRDWSAFTVVSAKDILDTSIDIDSAKQRLVLIGSSSLGVGDRVATPLAPERPGLGVQAAMLSTLLDAQAGSAPRAWPGRVMATLFAAFVALLAGYALPRLSAIASAALLAASALTWIALAYLISLHDSDFCTTGPLASLLFLLGVGVPFQWQLAQRRSRDLLDTLRQYVAPEVVEQLMRSDLQDPLAPRQCDVTTLIADMEGYTSQVESLPVEEAARLTRDFLDCLTGPVIDQHGTLDKYTGDGLVAFWGAPLPNAEHADLALDAALDIVRRVGALSAARLAQGKPALRVRIGVESGLAMAGDFGTSFRSIYTAVGDSVNTASRLEQVARAYPHDVMIGAGTMQRARRHHLMHLGECLLRGKEKPTVLYTFEPRPGAPLARKAQPERAHHIGTEPVA